MANQAIANLAACSALDARTARELWRAGGQDPHAHAAARAATAGDMKALSAANAAAVVARVTNPELLEEIWADRRITVRHAVANNPHMSSETARAVFLWLVESAHAVPYTVASALEPKEFAELAAHQVNHVNLDNPRLWMSALPDTYLIELVALEGNDRVLDQLQPFVGDATSPEALIEIYERCTHNGEIRDRAAYQLFCDGHEDVAWRLTAEDPDRFANLLESIDCFAELPEASMFTAYATEHATDALAAALARSATEEDLDVPSWMVSTALAATTRVVTYAPDHVISWLADTDTDGFAAALLRSVDNADIDRDASVRAVNVRWFAALLDRSDDYELLGSLAERFAPFTDDLLTRNVIDKWVTTHAAATPQGAAQVERVAKLCTDPVALYSAVHNPSLWSAELLETVPPARHLTLWLPAMSAPDAPIEVRQLLAAKLAATTAATPPAANPPAAGSAHAVYSFLEGFDIYDAAKAANVTIQDTVFTNLLESVELEPNTLCTLLSMTFGFDRWSQGRFEANLPNTQTWSWFVANVPGEEAPSTAWCAASRVTELAPDLRARAAFRSENLEMVRELLADVELDAESLALVLCTQDSVGAEELWELCGAWLTGGYVLNPPTTETLDRFCDMSANLSAAFWAAAGTAGTLPDRVAEWFATTDGLPRLWADEPHPPALTDRVAELLGLGHTTPVSQWLCAAELAHDFEGSFEELADLVAASHTET